MTDEPKPLSEAESYAVCFREMVARIEANKTEKFGGAFVVVPPGGGFFSTLFLDSEQDPVLFFQLLKARIDASITAMDQQQRRR